MKSTTTIPADIFNGDRELQMFLVPGLTPGVKLELPFLWEFPAFLERVSPLPAAKTIWEMPP
ncbi:MAG: hypothetical protein LBB26_00265 [Puniceicoccales bacterium]|jgi:hypothetical protein|nr:hypothetical protein [Puniceicoccales bacterium]